MTWSSRGPGEYVKQKDSVTDMDLPAFIRALDRVHGLDISPYADIAEVIS